MTPAAGASTPSVAQASSGPPPSVYRQREQGPPGGNTATWPSKRTTAPETSGLPARAQAALMAMRLAKLSVVSTTTSASRVCSSSAAPTSLRLMAGMRVSGLGVCSVRVAEAEITDGRPLHEHDRPDPDGKPYHDSRAGAEERRWPRPDPSHVRTAASHRV